MSYSRHRIAIVIMTGALVSGCGSAGVLDTMGFGKYSPDETQIRSNEALSMPPSLQLPPPSEDRALAKADDGGAAPKSLFAPQRVTAAPPNYGAPDPNDFPPPQVAEQGPLVIEPEPQKLASTEPQKTEPQKIVVDAPAVPAERDVFDENGISKVHPDGRAKTKVELLNELRKKNIERKRQENPSYGSIFNLPNVWSD